MSLLRCLILTLAFLPLAVAAPVAPDSPVPFDLEGAPRLLLPVPRGHLDPVPLPAGSGPGGWVLRLLPAGTDASLREIAIPSPAVCRGLVIAGGGISSFALHAFDVATGCRRWTASFDDNGPSTVAVGRDRVVTGTESCTTYGVDPATGSREWSEVLGPSILGAPTIAGDRVFIAATKEDQSAALFALDLRGGRRIWEAGLDSDIVGAPVAVGPLVVATLVTGRVVAFDRSGRTRWAVDLAAACAPFAEGTDLYFAAGSRSDPEILCVDGLDGRVRWRRPLLAPVEESPEESGEPDPRRSVTRPPAWAVHRGMWADDPPRPVVVDDLVVLAAGPVLSAFGREAGEPRGCWRLPDDDSFYAPPARLADRLLYGTTGGRLLEVLPRLGEVYRVVETGALIRSQPVVAGGRVFFTTPDCLVSLPWGDAAGPEWARWGGPGDPASR